MMPSTPLQFLDGTIARELLRRAASIPPRQQGGGMDASAWSLDAPVCPSVSASTCVQMCPTAGYCVTVTASSCPAACPTTVATACPQYCFTQCEDCGSMITAPDRSGPALEVRGAGGLTAFF